MSEIYRAYNGKQLLAFCVHKLLADDVGLTNFNEGSNIRSELEVICEIAAMIGSDNASLVRKHVPIVFYEGFNFKRKGATQAHGYMRCGRKPVFSFTYQGTAASALLSVTDTHFTISVPGQPLHDIAIDFTTCPDVSSLVAELHAHPVYDAQLVGSGSISCSELYHYTNKEIVNSTNYLNSDGCDVLTRDAPAVTIIPCQVSAHDLTFLTTASGEIPAGESSSDPIPAYCTQPGKNGNIEPYAIDTLNGKGYVETAMNGVEFIINDSSFSQGTDQETDEERHYRFRRFFAGLGGHTEAGWEAAILGIEGIKSVTVRSRYPQPGINTVIADDGTGNITSDLVTEIYKVIDGDPNDLENYPGCGVAGITVQVMPPVMTAVAVQCVLYTLFTVNVDIEEIKLKVQTVIENYVNTRKLGQDVLRSELIRLIKNTHTAIYDLDLVLPAASVVVGSDVIPRTGSGAGVPVQITTLTRMEP